ncbi:hypothetical protein [uncultured Sphingomonas sp.]|uniref:hypothetical protein n=1 Tax=uncultured Sphingomonas sp. TaxID=158754 RepID=UPI0025FEAC24|nr:hypothetical protein [uncultured Sphingomonas sp.]
MKGRGLDDLIRTAAIVGMGLALSAGVGVGTAKWTMAETSAFYTYPTDRGPPLYARQRAVADDLWEHQADSVTPTYSDYVAGVGSTATNVAPTYRSASGS